VRKKSRQPNPNPENSGNLTSQQHEARAGSQRPPPHFRSTPSMSGPPSPGWGIGGSSSSPPGFHGQEPVWPPPPGAMYEQLRAPQTLGLPASANYGEPCPVSDRWREELRKPKLRQSSVEMLTERALSGSSANVNEVSSMQPNRRNSSNQYATSGSLHAIH
jgi:hypothetical protein